VHRARRLALDQVVPSTDPLRDQQWGLDRINAEVAWAFTEGAAETVIALIDSGVEPGHPDLVSQWAFNAGEDLDGDGVLEPDGQGGWRLDPDDLDGQDTDGNGFVDDLLGWDFTDAPAFPAAGDYLEADNQPWDEHGHGTAMAGILAAARDNGLGILGVAPGCRVLPLRAANSAGWLEEDDVAAAILYAVDNEARLLNLSFGDPSSSPLMEDVLRWASDRGVIAVASSGNAGSGQARYPAAYPSVIAVGAARQLGDPPRIERFPIVQLRPGPGPLGSRFQHPEHGPGRPLAGGVGHQRGGTLRHRGPGPAAQP
jgi:subtilisin family serine protease